MDFRIADTFTDSLARLTGAEQRAVKTTAFDLQLDPSAPGMRFHRIERGKDPNFWSVRVNNDIRLIVHRTSTSLLLCYVGHHDVAYAWAERRKIERHPVTGAAQLVELRERVEEIPVLRPAAHGATARTKPPLFADMPAGLLLGYGMPLEWLSEVRRVNEDTLLDLADHLPQEAAEALLSLATGEVPTVLGTGRITVFDRDDTGGRQYLPDFGQNRSSTDADSFGHPDAQRRFRVLTNVEELERALDYPWEKWAVFLHPAQRRVVDRDYSGPARVSGSAGTGKTIVALQRAVRLARSHPGSRVLLTTFSKTLANALNARLKHLVSNEPEIANRINVHSVTGIAYELYTAAFGHPHLAP